MCLRCEENYLRYNFFYGNKNLHEWCDGFFHVGLRMKRQKTFYKRDDWFHKECILHDNLIKLGIKKVRYNPDQLPKKSVRGR